MKPNNNKNTELLSQLAYAKRRGCTHAAVAKAIKSGRLAKCIHRDAKGKITIDPGIADQEWAANTNEAKQSFKSESQSVGVIATAESSPAAGESKSAPRVTAKRQLTDFDAHAAAQAEDDQQSFSDARALKEHYLSLLAQLEYETKSGKLIDAQEARQAAFGAARKARDMLLTIADRLAPVVAGIDNQFECHQAISREVQRVCNELTENPLE